MTLEHGIVPDSDPDLERFADSYVRIRSAQQVIGWLEDGKDPARLNLTTQLSTVMMRGEYPEVKVWP